MNRFLKWKKKGRRKAGILWLAVFLAFGLWGISLWQGARIRAYADDIQIRYHGQGVPRQVVEQMREAGLALEGKDLPEMAAWNVEYFVEAKNPVLDFSQEVTCITARGAMDQIVKDRLVAGTYGFADDTEGCVISSKTAWALFGATNVTGCTITVKGKRFLVRGVTVGSYPLVILPAEAVGTQYFTGISLSGAGLGGLEGIAEETMMRFGLPGQEIRVNGGFYYAVVRLGAALPGWALLFVFCLCIRPVWRRGKCSGNGAYRNCLGRAALFLFIAGAAAALIWYGFRFPGEFIPSRWSDFSFYSGKLYDVKENILEIASLPKTRWDTEMIRAFALSVRCSAEAAVLIFIAGSLLLLPSGTEQKQRDLRDQPSSFTEEAGDR